MTNATKPSAEDLLREQCVQGYYEDAVTKGRPEQRRQSPRRAVVALIPPLIVGANWLLRHGGIDQQMAREIVGFVGGVLGVLLPVAGIVAAFWLRRES